MTSSQTDTIELAHIARTINRGRRAVFAFTLLGILGAAAVLLFAPRRYTASSTIVLKSSAAPTGASSLLSQVTGLADVTGGLLGGKSQLETEIEVLSSRAVLGEVVDSLRLQARLRASERLPAKDVLTALHAPGSFRLRRFQFVRGSDGTYGFEGSGERGSMRPGEPLQLGTSSLTFARAAHLPARFTLDLVDREDAIDRVEKRLDAQKKKGDLVAVSFVADDSTTAARVPNLVLTTYLNRRTGADRGVNHRRVEFLTAKGDSMARELAAAATALRRQQEASGVLDAAGAARIGLENTGALQTKLTDVLVEQGALQQLTRQIAERTLTPRQLAAYPTFLRSPAVNNIVSQLTDVETKRTMLLRSKTEEDEEVAALTLSARNLEQQLVPYATAYATSLAKQRADLEAALAEMNADLARLPRAAEATSQLQFKVQDLARLSSALQAQLVEAKLAAIGEGGDLHPLDVAVAPKRPSFPNPPLTAAAGLFGGVFTGMVAALLMGALSRWADDPIDIERTLGVPAVRFDPAAPLLISNAESRTIVVSPIAGTAPIDSITRRLAETAASRSISAVVLSVEDDTPDVNASIARLQAEYELVIVGLPSLTSNAAAATLHSARPVLLVSRGPRVARQELERSIQLLKRLDVPCAGVILNSQGGPKALAAHDRVLSG